MGYAKAKPALYDVKATQMSDSNSQKLYCVRGNVAQFASHGNSVMWLAWQPGHLEQRTYRQINPLLVNKRYAVFFTIKTLAH